MERIGWESIAGHTENIARIRALIQQGKMPHALLFVGPEGIGKFLVAQLTAAALFCKGQEKPCGACASCRAFFAGSHPDLCIVEPDGQAIKIEQIRALQTEVSRTPYLTDRRIVIINQAELMTLPSANSLLKTLEEPVGTVIFILVASSRQMLLETILSRCVLLAFQPLSRLELAELLQRRGGVNVAAIACLADGSVGKAVRLQENGGLALRERALQLLQIGAKMPMREVWNQSAALNELERGAFQELLLYLNLLLRDLLVWPSNEQGILLYNADIANELATCRADWPKRRLFGAMEEIATAQKMLNANGNQRLTIEQFLIKLRDL